MLNSLFTMTMTNHNDRYKPYSCWGGHGGHGGHGVFLTHMHARADERTRKQSIFYLLATPYVYINTMTTMTTMTIVVIARVVAVIVGGHSKKQGDQSKKEVLWR